MASNRSSFAGETYEHSDEDSDDEHRHENDGDSSEYLKKMLHQSMKKADYLKAVLFRRTNVIDEIRKAYLRDVVALKQVMNDVLKDGEREKVLHNYNAYIPSVDLRGPLHLHSPEEALFLVKPCESCGGQLDVIFSDSTRVNTLRNTVDALKAKEEQLRLTTATLETKLEIVERQLAAAEKSHTEEVRH